MVKQQQLILAESLLPHLHNYNNGNKTIISVEEKQQLKLLIQSIYNTTPNMNCDSCVIHYLNQILSWYERESQLAPVEEKPKLNKKNCCKNK